MQLSKTQLRELEKLKAEAEPLEAKQQLLARKNGIVFRKTGRLDLDIKAECDKLEDQLKPLYHKIWKLRQIRFIG